MASEDIGNANPTALVMANSTMQAVATIGMPEARIILSQCATYMACSPKSNSAYKAINHALETVKNTGKLSVPLDLRNAPTKLMKTLGYGEEYKYAHDYEQNFVAQEFLPKGIENTTFYAPGDNSRRTSTKRLSKTTLERQIQLLVLLKIKVQSQCSDWPHTHAPNDYLACKQYLFYCQ